MSAGVSNPRRFWSLVWFQVLLVIALLISAVSMSTALLQVKLDDETLFTYRSRLNQTNIDMLTLQSSLRGYIATSEPVILADYQQKMPELEAALDTLVAEAPFPESTMTVLRDVKSDFHDWRLRYAEREIALIQDGQKAAANDLLEESNLFFDAMVDRVADQRVQLRNVSGEKSATIKQLSWAILGTVGLLSLLLFLGIERMTRMWRRQRGLLQDLEQLTAELQTSNAELQTSTKAQEQINQSLVKRVDESYLLNRVSILLAQDQPLGEALETIAQRLGTFMKSWCVIWLRASYDDPQADPTQLILQTIYHPDATRRDAVRDWLEYQRINIHSGLHAPLFVEQAASVVLLSVPDELRAPLDMSSSNAPALELLRLEAYLAVPLVIDGERIGLISVASADTPGAFDAPQEIFMLRLADLVAKRIDRDNLLALAERRAAALQITFDSISDVVTVYDDLGAQQSINLAGNDFAPAGELQLERPGGHLLTDEEHPVLRALAGETVADYELALVRADGSRVIHAVSAAPIRASGAEVTGAVLVARNIALRKELERIKDEFMANMSHELRTPLTAIMGYSELLLKRRNEVLTPWHINKIDGIRIGGQRLLILVNDLLDLAKLDAGQIELYIRENNLVEVIESQTELLMSQIQDKRLHLELNLLPLGNLLFDTDRIGQVVMNLLSNAIKFTPEQGRIRISSDLVTLDERGLHWSTIPLTAALSGLPAGQYVAVAITDSGVGIPGDALPHVWDRFYQVEGGASRRFGGTGLGLAIVRQLVELHHGSVWADSPGVDQGSTFGFVLPLNSPNAPEALPHRAHAPSILVVDDDPATLAIFSQHLYDAGYNVITASSSADALRLAQVHRPDAITLDLILPDGDGWATLAALRQMPVLADTPVVIASIADVPRDYPMVGVSTYLVKPITGERLVTVMETVIGSNAASGDVLIVDDDPELVNLLQISLEEHGFSTRTARDGAEALDELQREPLPLLVLLDLMMPVVNGFQLLARMRDDPRTRQVPVVILTARDLTNEEVHQLRYAAQGLYAKHNFDLDALVQLVQQHMPQREDPADGGSNDSGR